MFGKAHNLRAMWKILMQRVDLEKPTSFLDQEDLGCTLRDCKPDEILINEYRKLFASRIFAGATEKKKKKAALLLRKVVPNAIAGFFCMDRHAKKCVERCCALANKKTSSSCAKSPHHFLDDHQLEKEELGTVEELPNTCSQMGLKCLVLARTDSPDILWSADNLARPVPGRSRASGKLLIRFTSYIPYTCHCRQHCYVGNTAEQCRLGLSQD